MNHLRSAKSSLLSGFSLIEMIVVIGVIGAMTSLVAPTFGSIKDAAGAATNQDNAQSIVSTFKTGDAAQINWITTSRSACIADVIAGRSSPSTSIFAGQHFSVPHLSADNLKAASRYIGMDSRNQLFYDASGSQPGQ